MKKRTFITIGIFALLIGFMSLTAFTKADKLITQVRTVQLQKQTNVKRSYYKSVLSNRLSNPQPLTGVYPNSDCSETTWTSGITMDILYNAATQYNSFSMNFTGTGPYVFEYSVWANGPSYGFMGADTIHNFLRNHNYMFPVSLPPGDYAIDFIIKNECGEDLSDPQEFLFTNEKDIE